MSLSTPPSDVQGCIITSGENTNYKDSFARYVEPKVHCEIRNHTWSKIIVRGCYLRAGPSTTTTDNERQHQRFNWQRPTATRVTQDVLRVNCFPGRDYVEHYARMIASYLDLKGRTDELVIERPFPLDAAQILYNSNLQAMGKVAIVVVGDLHCFRGLANNRWVGDSDEGQALFSWQKFSGKNTSRIAFLGCKISLWGDIAGQLVHVLNEINEVQCCIYVAKAGSLRPEDKPNTRIATGTQSILDGRLYTWEPGIGMPKSPILYNGLHTTITSPLLETEDWLTEQISRGVHWVDCEVGHMAKAAIQTSIAFTYLHILSDNVTKKYEYNLSNEDEEEVMKARRKLFDQLWIVIRQKLLDSFGVDIDKDIEATTTDALAQDRSAEPRCPGLEQTVIGGAIWDSTETAEFQNRTNDPTIEHM